MPQVAIADGEIHYEVAGEGHPLILVSGLNGVARYWEPQIAAFSARYRVITYDQRGTGTSDHKQREFSIDQMTRELVALMDALKIDRAHIVGLSTGGAIGQTLAIEYPAARRAPRAGQHVDALRPVVPPAFRSAAPHVRIVRAGTAYDVPPVVSLSA